MKGAGLAFFAAVEPEATALIDSDGRAWTRKELSSLVNRISRGLRTAGFGPGDVICAMMPNCAEYLATFIAATQVGLYFVPVNWHLSSTEIAYILADSGARALLVHERLGMRTLRNLRDGSASETICVCVGRSEGYRSLEEFASGHSDEPILDVVAGRVLQYTSATTGRPKAIHLALHSAAEAHDRTIRFHIAAGAPLGRGPVHLFASMLYHAAPLEGASIGLHMGHVVVLVDRPDPEAVLRLIDSYRVTSAFIVPTTFVRMLKLPREVRNRYSVASLNRVIHSGSPCPVEVKREMMEWFGPIIWDTYGAAEGAGTIASPEDWLNYPGTVGCAIPGSQLLVLDENDQPLPAGQVGTIYFTRYTGDNFEYRGDPEKTRACHRGDFFTVGDVGYLNEDGYLFICDRKIDMIISGGMNIYSAEIERLLVNHPAVTDCAVIGMPDEILGEAVKAFIQLAPGVTGGPQLTGELLQFLGKQLAAVKLPRRIEYVSDLPRDPTGKLFKRRLRERMNDQLRVSNS